MKTIPSIRRPLFSKQSAWTCRPHRWRLTIVRRRGWRRCRTIGRRTGTLTQRVCDRSLPGPSRDGRQLLQLSSLAPPRASRLLERGTSKGSTLYGVRGLTDTDRPASRRVLALLARACCVARHQRNSSSQLYPTYPLPSGPSPRRNSDPCHDGPDMSLAAGRRFVSPATAAALSSPAAKWPAPMHRLARDRPARTSIHPFSCRTAQKRPSWPPLLDPLTCCFGSNARGRRSCAVAAS